MKIFKLSTGEFGTIKVLDNLFIIDISGETYKCFIKGNIDNFVDTYFLADDHKFIRDIIFESIFTKENTLHWINNGNKITALEYADLYVSILGLLECERLLQYAKDKGHTKGIYYPPENSSLKRINLFYLRKAINNRKEIK